MAERATNDKSRLVELAESLRASFVTIEDMAYGFVREAILRGHFRPGERLPQDALGAVLGVSRMPVRSALRQLEAEGLVNFEPHRGATVRMRTPEEIREIYELRTEIECYLIDRAAPELSDALLDELEEAVASLRTETDSARWLERRHRLYERLYSVAEVPRVLAIMLDLRAEVGPYLVMRRERNTSVDHIDVLDHLRARDAAGAKKWVRSHLATVSRDLQELVRSMSVADDPDVGTPRS